MRDGIKEKTKYAGYFVHLLLVKNANLKNQRILGITFSNSSRPEIMPSLRRLVHHAVHHDGASIAILDG
jgi:hypothetical protein